MGLGKRCSSLKSKRGAAAVAAGKGLGLDAGVCTRALGRKRIAIPSSLEASPIASPFKSPIKRRCHQGVLFKERRNSRLESLPQDVLIKILCGVDHEDLRQLVNVSKTVREATLIAKQWHFAYSTPRKTHAFRNSLDFSEPEGQEDMEAPNAPRRSKTHRSRLSGKNLTEISIALFT